MKGRWVESQMAIKILEAAQNVFFADLYPPFWSGNSQTLTHSLLEFPATKQTRRKNPSKPDSHIKWRSNDQLLWVHWFLIFDPWPNMLFKTRFHVDLGVVMDLSGKYNTFELPKKQVYCKHSVSTNETTRNQQIGPTCAFHTVHRQWIYSTLSNLVLYQLPFPPC